MNNSDFQDFQNWQNGDDNWQEEMRKYLSSNPSFKHGFFYYNPMSNSFKKLWEKINSNEDPTENLKDYLNIDDLIGENKQISKKPNRNRNGKTIMFTQEEYQKLIEIRGYLAITEQRAHVKALDKVLSHIKMIPQPPTR